MVRLSNMLTIEAVRTLGTNSGMLDDRRGRFTLGNPWVRYLAARKAIQKAMWHVGSVNWLKYLLLAHNNNSTIETNPPLVNNAWMANLPTLNAEQNSALARAAHQGRDLTDIVTIIQGPPGTGKSAVIGLCILNLNCMEHKQPW